MRIALVSSDPGTSYGGTEVLMDALAKRLRDLDIETDMVFHPASFSNLEEITSTISLVQKLDLTEYDMVITFRFPSYFVDHPNKLIWLLHQFRPLMDNYGTEFGFPKTFSNDLLKQQLERLDQEVFSKAGRKLRVNSEITRSRTIDSVGINPIILMCPLSHQFEEIASITKPPEVVFDNFIFAGGRISPDKRQHLAVFAAIESGVKLVVAGPPDNSDYTKELLRLAESKQILIIPRKLSPSELAWLYSHCMAVFYGPKNEDSYGYIAGEASYFGAEVITCLDSGDVASFGSFMKSGVAEPNYFDIASHFTRFNVLPNEIRRREIRDNWKTFSTDWKEVEEWVLQNLS